MFQGSTKQNREEEISSCWSVMTQFSAPPLLLFSCPICHCCFNPLVTTAICTHTHKYFCMAHPLLDVPVTCVSTWNVKTDRSLQPRVHVIVWGQSEDTTQSSLGLQTQTRNHTQARQWSELKVSSLCKGLLVKLLTYTAPQWLQLPQHNKIKIYNQS